MKKIREQADLDVAHNKPSELRTFDRNGAPQEFSDRGRADIKIRRNDPRFADNAMQDDSELLDEFAEESQIDRLHQMLSQAGISDQQIRGGIKLTQGGMNKVAGRLGVGPDDVGMYINSLVQQLRDADETSIENLTEQYYNAVNVIDEDDEDVAEAGQPDRPFDSSKDRYSFEPDALGSVTVRDAATGRSRFVQGAEASSLLRRLEAPGANRQAVLAPLVEKALPDSKTSFKSEINANSGTYNFQWKIGAQHGLGTVMFSAEHGPHMELVDVRDSMGDEIDVDPGMHDELLNQARNFLGNE